VFRDLQKDPKNPANLRNWAKAEPDKFYPLAAKLIPTEVRGEMNHTVTPNINCVVEAMGVDKFIVNTEPLGEGGRKPGLNIAWAKFRAWLWVQAHPGWCVSYTWGGTSQRLRWVAAVNPSLPASEWKTFYLLPGTD
jgi:hypothetical protein